MKKIAVIGLGYVGLPLCVRLCSAFNVVGYDISTQRISDLSDGVDVNGEFCKAELSSDNLFFTSDESSISDASVYIITVPTPIDEYRAPDLAALKSATQTVGKALKKGDMVVSESTVYPGATEDVCVPILEHESGLKMGIDFMVGYSPERVSPGKNGKKINEISKIISVYNLDKVQELYDIYSHVTDESLHLAPSIKVAELAKVLENTQRDLNIALMNEISHICHKLDIKTRDVLDAAATKWNFQRFEPGLVGGHCIGVDPYYLLSKAEQLGYSAEVITAGRRTNEKIPHFITKRVVSRLAKLDKPLNAMRIAILGVTFKENCPDCRNSKALSLAPLFSLYGISCDHFDPYACNFKSQDVGVSVLDDLPAGGDLYDAIILAVAHDRYLGLAIDDLESYLTPESRALSIVFDVKGIHRKTEYMEL